MFCLFAVLIVSVQLSLVRVVALGMGGVDVYTQRLVKLMFDRWAELGNNLPTT